MSPNDVSYPRQSARTQRFTLGAPHAVVPAPDGRRVSFLRSRGGTDRVTCLWTLDTATGHETLVADPLELLGDATAAENLSPQERARRERLREGAAGVVGYATDRACVVAAFALSSRLFVADLVAGTSRELAAATPVVDPRPDPTGARIAYAAAGALHVVDADGSDGCLLVGPQAGETDVTWGTAEFVAAEEMGRYRGFWWSTDGERLLVTRVDVSPVQRWWIADPEHPERPPAEVAYPAAGTPNADVRLFLVDLDGTRREVRWDRAELPYLADVHWSSYGAPLVTVQSRDQRIRQVLSVEPATGATRLLVEDSDPAWTDLVAGVPAWSPDGRLVRTVDDQDTRRLAVGEDLLTPVGLQVAAVLDVDAAGVLVAASSEPTEQHLWRVAWDGAVTRLTSEPGVHSGRLAGDLLVVSRASLDSFGAEVVVRRGDTQTPLHSYAETPCITPSVALLHAGGRGLRTALLLPTGWQDGQGRLPVLMDPYGGPHAQRVVAARNVHLGSQWFADQGFAVVVVDGRGTPGRGPAWERAVSGDLAGPVLDDQIEALRAVAAEHPDLDLDRVGIRGWSFGGYLAALAVLRRPDVFHAAVAGAPVTDWALYDTHYTERYLGTPQGQPDAYAGSSLVAAVTAGGPGPQRPLMLVHGLADDNVVAAHTLTLSSALLAAGRAHTVLPLSGVTHMTPQEVVAENLLLLQVRFLHDALG